MIATSVGPGTAWALHLDVLSEQENGRIVTGTGDFDHDLWTLGERVFHRDLGPTPATNPTYLSNNNPGFNSIGDGSPDMPAGAQALPPNEVLSWAFLPMTITNGNDSLSQNLFYSDGQDTDGVPGLTPADVKFGPIPTSDYRLSLLDFNSGIHSVDGTNTIVPGGKIALTAADGFMHQHLFLPCKTTMATTPRCRWMDSINCHAVEDPQPRRLVAYLHGVRNARALRFRPRTMRPSLGSSSNSIFPETTIKTASSTWPIMFSGGEKGLTQRTSRTTTTPGHSLRRGRRNSS